MKHVHILQILQRCNILFSLLHFSKKYLLLHCVVCLIDMLMELLKSWTNPLKNISAWAVAVIICHDHQSREIHSKGPMGVLHQKRQQGKWGSGLQWMYKHRLFCICVVQCYFIYIEWFQCYRGFCCCWWLREIFLYLSSQQMFYLGFYLDS